MELELFEHLKKLYDYELYSSAITTASVLNSMLQNDRMRASDEMEYQVKLIQAYSYYQERQFRVATRLLDSALLMRKSMVRLKKNQLLAIESVFNQFTEAEIRYKLAICYKETGEQLLAITTLQALKVRPPKVNMLLGKLSHYGRTANSTEAILAYKEVVRENSFALEAIEAMLQLGMDGIEVNSLVINANDTTNNIEWLGQWIKGHAEIYSRKHLEASKTFQQINDSTKLHQNEHLLTLIGKSLYYYGSFTQAQMYLEMALMVGPSNLEALMALSVVYEYNKKLQDLDKLAAQFTNLDEFGSEQWFILGENFYATGKMDKALSFTNKAISMNPRNVEGQLLRGKICLHLKRHKEAIYFFRAAQCIATYRFEIYKGLFHCYVGLKRVKEAQTICAMAVRYFRNSPRSFVMIARTLFHSTNPQAKPNAKKFINKALELDDHYAPAVALMAELCQAEGEPQEAISLLKKQVASHPHHKLFTMLGDISRAENDLTGALEYYTMALSMEPNYHRALEGINAFGQASKAPPTQQEQNASMADETPDEEWPAEEMSDTAETSSPVPTNDDAESDTLSDQLWADGDAELTN